MEVLGPSPRSSSGRSAIWGGADVEVGEELLGAVFEAEGFDVSEQGVLPDYRRFQ
jgi:hypothetical protein